MSYYVIVFDRRASTLLDLTPFPDHADALRRRRDLEASHRPSVDMEIVVLVAESEDALRLTHARYFETAEQLADGAGKNDGR